MSSIASIRVGIKYCGHCNAQIDGPEMVDELKTKTSDITFAPYDDPTMDLLLIISGCKSNCVVRPVFDGPTIEVSGNSLNNRELPASDIPKEIIRKINEFRKSMVNQRCIRKNSKDG